jgi:polysaccharide chain length determinant protein (PEP-CTERM system associated)
MIMPEESELPEEQKSGGADVQRYLSVIGRRHVTFLVAVFFGWLVVWGASWVLPARYKSGTLILVEQPTMPKNYVEPNVNEDLQDRLQSITQQILSRTRLLLIIDKLHLYSESHKQITPDDKVERMRKDIGIELVHGSQNDQITAFKVSYSAGDPHTAQEVTSELTDLFINENLKVRQQQSEDTTRFIGEQLENARATLVEQEGKVREFEGNHEGELPSQQASNLQILSGLQAQLQNEQDALNTAKQQRVYYQTLIDQYRTLQTATIPRSAGGASTGLHAIDQELDRLKSKLADSSSHYTDRYPDLQSLKAQISKTEKTRADIIANLSRKNSSGETLSGGSVASDVTDASQNSPLLQLQSQLQANQAEIASRDQGIASLKARVNGYQSRLNNGPAREQELAELTRGYDQSKANYDDLLKKKNGSEMATSMEQMQEGERFRMLDPPSLPIKPYFPDRLKLCGIGLGVGLALGIVVVCAFEMMDDRMHTDREIKALLPVAIISEIPEIVIPSEERSKKKQMAIGWAISALVAVTILAGSAFSYLHE